MKTLKSLKGIKVLDSSELRTVKGGTGDRDQASQFTNIQSTCSGEYADQSGQARTDWYDGGTWIYGPWKSYKTIEQAYWH